MIAYKKGHTEIVKLLIEQEGININTQWSHINCEIT